MLAQTSSAQQQQPPSLPLKSLPITSSQAASASIQSAAKNGLPVPIGGMPDQELLLRPRWLVFSAEDAYRRAQFAIFKLVNQDESTIAFRLRVRDRFPLLSVSHGFIEPLGSVNITMIVPSVEHWPRAVDEYTGRRHKICVDSLTVPDSIARPTDRDARTKLCRNIFHATTVTKPQTRIYVKLSYVLPRLGTVGDAYKQPT